MCLYCKISCTKLCVKMLQLKSACVRDLTFQNSEAQCMPALSVVSRFLNAIYRQLVTRGYLTILLSIVVSFKNKIICQCNPPHVVTCTNIMSVTHIIHQMRFFQNLALQTLCHKKLCIIWLELQPITQFTFNHHHQADFRYAKNPRR